MFEDVEIIDLSPELVPGHEDRRLAIRPFITEQDQTLMHDIDMMSHVGVHIEAPFHYKEDLKGISELPLSSFFGDGLCIDVSGAGKAGAITPDTLLESGPAEGVKPGDIVLLHSMFEGEDVPYISRECAEFLGALPIKMLGIDSTIRLEETHTGPGGMATHDSLLRKDIPLIERLVNLDKVKGKRFLFFGFPLRIKGLDSSPIRAVALVKK